MMGKCIGSAEEQPSSVSAGIESQECKSSRRIKRILMMMIWRRQKLLTLKEDRFVMRAVDMVPTSMW